MSRRFWPLSRNDPKYDILTAGHCKLLKKTEKEFSSTGQGSVIAQISYFLWVGRYTVSKAVPNSTPENNNTYYALSFVLKMTQKKWPFVRNG